MSDNLCRLDGCDDVIRARGMCNRHYLKWARKNLPGMGRGAPKPRKQCSVEGCDDPFRARDLCARHYNEWRLANETPEQKKKRLAKMLMTYRNRANQAENEEGMSFAVYLRMRWEQIGQLAAARRFTA